jgi:hypothetical protein
MAWHDQAGMEQGGLVVVRNMYVCILDHISFVSSDLEKHESPVIREAELCELRAVQFDCS